MALQDVIDSIEAGIKQTYTKEDVLFILKESGLEEKPEVDKPTPYYKTISCVVQIGKKKNIVFTFLAKDFDSICDKVLILKNEHREAKIDLSQQREIIRQLNNL